MTLVRTLCILILLCGGLSAGAPVTANPGPADRDESASAAYRQGDYKPAYKQYLKLAKDGDAFAQYRVSYMELMGLGTRPDAVEAMAWAVLAAESGHQELVRYQEAIAGSVPVEERKKAQARADYYLRRWGRDDRKGGGTLARTSEGVCTGSRLAGNCGQGQSGAGKWIAWGDDRSADPAQKDLIENLNREIQQNPEEIRNHSGDS